MAYAATAEESSKPDSRTFIWRRLHSLTGIVPVGGFLIFHMYENMSALKGPLAYDVMVNNVNTLLPRMYFFGLELFGILLPLAFHALYGVWLSVTGQPNVGKYAYGANWLYLLQRVSGLIAFVYIVVHVGVLRYVVTLLGQHLAPYHGPTEPGGLDLVTYADVAAHLGNPAYIAVDSWMAGPWMFWFYVVGTLATLFHFTNGLNGFCWTWGITIGRVAQKRVAMFAWGLFAVLAVVTINILVVMRFTTPA
jgi:succinate dehydrogenase / fumarate reductase, cytochrome b subunit